MIEPECHRQRVLDPAKLKEAVKNAILSGDTELDLKGPVAINAFLLPRILPRLRQPWILANKYLNAAVTYTFGNATEVLDKNTINTMLAVDGKGRTSSSIRIS